MQIVGHFWMQIYSTDIQPLYNTAHKHSGLKFTTPEQRHTGEAAAILEHRQQVYRLARDRNPNRWSGEIRNWELPEKVWLNPEKEQSNLRQAA